VIRNVLFSNPYAWEPLNDNFYKKHNVRKQNI